jgi:hypothetical protein
MSGFKKWTAPAKRCPPKKRPFDPFSIPSIVDQADVSAEIMRPLLQNNHVTVQAYRTLRWGGKTGLLLEPA